MLTKVFAVIDKVFSFIEDWVLFLTTMAALIALFINVILRYGFNYSLAWSEELVREVIIVTTFIGCSAATKVRAMVKVDALIQLVPVTKYPLMFFANLVTLLFSGMMIYYGWKLVLMQAATEQVTILLQIPLELLYSVLPIMGIMMFIRTLMVMHQDWQAWQKTRAAKPA
jgi:TRAP-type C4-dicarboxylate transport system permease small subunit